MRLHLIGNFCTSPVAIQKAMLFSRMMQMQGYDVIEYNNEGKESGTCQIFKDRVIEEVSLKLQPEDIICHFSGNYFEELLSLFPEYKHVEVGVGYNNPMQNSFRVFESYAWMHYSCGKEGNNGKNYDWVVPPYHNVDDWEPCYDKGSYFAFIGDITSCNGMNIIRTIADYSSYPILIRGKGDPSPWAHPNILYRGLEHSSQNSEFLRNAKALLIPGELSELSHNMSIEAMLSGTPVISADYGTMTETVQEGLGFRCHTLQDWLEAMDNIDSLDRHHISDTARSYHNLDCCGLKYDKIFRQVNDLYRKGWYEVTFFNYHEIENEEKPFAKRIAQWIHDNIKPEKVLDIGCGPGMYVTAMRELGIDAKGYDINPKIQYNDHIIQKSVADLTETADLVICFEVAEHIPEQEAILFLEDTLKCVSERGLIIWTAACPGQGGVGHINCQTKDYWVQKFEERGFIRQYDIERQVVDYIAQGYHMGWFLQNAVVFSPAPLS